MKLDQLLTTTMAKAENLNMHKLMYFRMPAIEEKTRKTHIDRHWIIGSHKSYFSRNSQFLFTTDTQTHT